MYINKKILILSSILLSSSFLMNDIALSKTIETVELNTNNKIYNIPSFNKDNHVYISLDDYLTKEKIVYKKDKTSISFVLDNKKIVFNENSSFFSIEENDNSYEYPLVVEKIHNIKEFYLPKNNLKTIYSKSDEQLYVPLELLENHKLFNKEITENKDKYSYEIQDKEVIVYNYNYEDSFDEITNQDLLDGQTAKYTLFDEKYNALAVGEKVSPSPKTGFSTIKPKYGFGSDTFTYKQSKGSASLDGWQAGKISIPLTTDKEKIKESFQKDLGLINGEYMFIDEFGTVLRIDFDTIENGVIIILNSDLYLEEKPETYRGKVILLEILSYYINDTKIINDIEKKLMNSNGYEEKTLEENITNDIIFEQYHSNLTLQINFKN